jgi:hypothetical protein
MALAAALMLLLQAQPKVDAVRSALGYLCAHQADNGAWGRRPATCTCAAEPVRPAAPADEATRVRVAVLIREMNDDDPEQRFRAQKAVAAIGAPAIAQLQEAAARGEVEVRWRSAAALREIECATTEDDVEATGFAILALLGAGYTSLSKDHIDGVYWIGPVVEKGLRWLIDRQRPDGSFGGKDAAADALAALALSEAVSMEPKSRTGEPAQKAVDFIVANRATDARGLLYQGMTLKSAELSELSFPKKTARRVTDALAAKRGDEPSSIFVMSAIQLLKIFTTKVKGSLDFSGIPGIDPSRMEMETIYVVSLALFQFEGPGGPRWREWNESVKRWLVLRQQQGGGRCDRGSWEAAGTRGRLRSAAQGALSREIYYIYAIEK